MAIRPIDMDKVRHRESQAIKSATANQLRMGVGVSDYAQLTFDLLSKTLPCRWKKEKIIVMDEVLVSAPYGIEDIHGKDSISVNRVRKVVSDLFRSDSLCTPDRRLTYKSWVCL